MHEPTPDQGGPDTGLNALRRWARESEPMSRADFLQVAGALYDTELCSEFAARAADRQMANPPSAAAVEASREAYQRDEVARRATVLPLDEAYRRAPDKLRRATGGTPRNIADDRVLWEDGADRAIKLVHLQFGHLVLATQFNPGRGMGEFMVCRCGIMGGSTHFHDGPSAATGIEPGEWILRTPNGTLDKATDNLIRKLFRPLLPGEDPPEPTPREGTEMIATAIAEELLAACDRCKEAGRIAYGPLHTDVEGETIDVRCQRCSWIVVRFRRARVPQVRG